MRKGTRMTRRRTRRTRTRRTEEEVGRARIRLDRYVPLSVLLLALLHAG